VLVSQYGEIVVDKLYTGNTILLGVLPSLIQQAEEVLNLIAWKRKHTIIRVDAGGGTIDSIILSLSAGYAVESLQYSAGHASRLVKNLNEWIDDPDQPEPPVSRAVPSQRRLHNRWQLFSAGRPRQHDEEQCAIQ